MKVKIFKSVINDAKAYTSFSNALLKIDLSNKQISQALSKLSQARNNFSNLSKYEVADLEKSYYNTEEPVKC